MIKNQGTVEGIPSTHLNFQARLLGGSGAIVPDGNYHVRFKLYNVDTGGSALWTETRTTGSLVAVKSGYLSVYLGSVTAFPGTINWNEEHWLTMDIGGTGGSATWDGEMNPRIKLTAVPFAFQAEQLASTNGAHRGTLKFGSVTNDPQITLPNATGTVCLDSNNCSYAAGSGDGDYIQNGTSQQTNANFNILASSGVAATIQGASGQNIFVLNQNGGAAALTVSSAGLVTLANDLAVNGGDITSSGALNITPGGALVVGATGQTVTLQGTTTTITSNGAGNDITLTSADQIILNSASILARSGGNTVASIDSNGALELLANGFATTTVRESALTVDGTITKDGVESFYALKFASTINVDADPSGFGGDVMARDESIRVIDTAITDGGGHISFMSVPTVRAAGNVASIVEQVSGLQSDVILERTGSSTLTVNNIYGSRFGTMELGAGVTVGNRYGVRVDDAAGSGTLTNQSGLMIEALTKGTNNAGVLIGEATGTNQANLVIGQTTVPAGSYSIYNSSTDQNYFAGNVGIGDASPVATLTVGNGDLFQVAGATGNITTAGDAAINGGDITSSGALNITPGGALTVGATGQTTAVQGTTLSLTSNGGTNDITLTSADQIILNANNGSTVAIQDATTITGLTSGSATTLTVNNSTSTGSILVLQDNGTPVFTVADGGDVTAAGSLVVQGANGIDIAPDTTLLEFGTAGTKKWGLGPRDANNFFTMQYQGTEIAAFSNDGRLMLGGNGNPDARLELRGDLSKDAWGFNGIQIQVDSASYTDESTANSGTATNAVFNSFGQPTLRATHTGVTTTNAATVYVQDSPVAGLNQTITNAYALWVDNGVSRFDGNVVLGSLGSASNNSVVCRNGSNQLAACSSTFATTATAFLQGGNDFGANAVLGTTGAGQTLSFITAGTTRLTIDTSGNGILTGTLTVQGTGTSSFAGNLQVDGNTTLGDLTGDTLTINGTAVSIPNNLNFDSGTLFIDAANNRVGMGTTAPDGRLHIQNTAPTGTGTITSTGTTTTVTGSGTAFSTQLTVGDTITANGQTRYVTAITNNTSLTVSADFNPDVTAGSSFTFQKAVLRMAESSGSTIATIDSQGALKLIANGYNTTAPADSAITIDSTITKDGVESFYAFEFIPTINVNVDPSLFGSDFLFRDGSTRLINATAGTLTDSGGHTTFSSSPTIQGTGNFSSTIGQVMGVQNHFTLNKTGTGTLTATNIYGAVSSGVVNANTVATNRYGFKVDDVTGTGTVTNQYGVYVSNLSKGTNDYGVYIEGADTAGLKVVRGETLADVLTVQTVVDGNLGNNSGAEDNTPTTDFTNAWTTFGTSTITRDTDAADIVSGVASVSAVFGTTDENGVRNNLTANPALSTEYTVSFVARLTAGTAFTDMAVRYTPNGGTNNIDCTNYTTQTLTAGFVKITCTILTDNTAVSNPDLIIRQPTPPGSGRTVHIDNFSMVPRTSSSSAASLRIGSAVGQGLQLLTLDHGATRPWTGNSNALYGSMYYDTVLGKIQCYEADGWGACGGAPDNIVNLVPEYAGSVLNGSGIGTMTADLCSDALNINDSGGGAVCSTSQSFNYYKWTSPQGTSQTYSIYISYQLPASFNGFLDDNTVKLTARRTSSSASVMYQLYQANGSQCGSDTPVTSSDNTWQTVNLIGNETGCTFAANDVITFRINMTASSGASAFSSNFSFTTLGK